MRSVTLVCSPDRPGFTRLATVVGFLMISWLVSSSFFRLRSFVTGPLLTLVLLLVVGSTGSVTGVVAVVAGFSFSLSAKIRKGKIKLCCHTP